MLNISIPSAVLVDSFFPQTEDLICADQRFRCRRLPDNLTQSPWYYWAFEKRAISIGQQPSYLKYQHGQPERLLRAQSQSCFLFACLFA